jgi:tight adherence protein B
MAARVDNDDFEWVVQAVDINREVGGDLTEVLDRVGETIRERDQIRRQVKALSAEGRLSALILIGLPIGMFGFIRVVNPEYIGELTGSSAGIVMIVVGVVLLLLGSIWLRNIVRVRF